MDELCWLSATEARRRFQARALSPVELVTALLDRIAAVEPQVRAFTRVFEDRALEAARQAEARYASGCARPLEGLPVAVKDLHAVEGEITTHGSLIFEHNRDETTLPTVARLLEAGAILLGRTTSPEFGSATVTWSRLWGVTRNPWNLAFSPGGSSGGAGAALAAGMTTLADGSDYGGSIRIPASCCGLVGYKPPHGRNPGDATVSLDPCSHFGPLARTVADAALMQNVMSGPSELDLASLPERVTLPLEGPRDLAGWKVAFSMDLGYFQVDPEVAEATRQALGLLRDLGCALEPVELGWTDAVRQAYEDWHAAADAASCEVLLGPCRDQLCDYTIHEIERGLAVPARALFAVNAVRAEMYRTLGPILARSDLFVCPTTALPSVPAEHSPTAGPLSLGGQRLEPARGWVLTYPFNLLGALPVLSVPSGRARSGVPTGVQLVGRHHDDLRVFQAAYALERARGPWFAAPEHRPAL